MAVTRFGMVTPRTTAPRPTAAPRRQHLDVLFWGPALSGLARFAESCDLERHLLRRDLLRRERQQTRLVLVGKGDFHYLPALPADGEGELPVAGAVAAGDERRARLETVYHPLLHQVVQRTVDRGGMGDAYGPHPVEDGIGAHGLLGFAQAGQDLALIARKLGRVVMMGGVHTR